MIQLSPFCRPSPSGRAARALESLVGADLRWTALFRVFLSIAALSDLGAPPPPPFPAAPFAALRALAALLLLAGWRSRAMALACGLLALAGGPGPDAPLPAAFLWSVFLPIGGRFSVDAALDASGTRAPERLLTLGTVAFFGQALVPQFVRGALLFSREGFPWLAAVCAVPFFPSAAWNALSPAGGEGLVVYFDADCGFCRRSVHLLRTFLLVPRALVLEAQTDAAALAEMTARRSWVVRDASGKSHYEYDALLAILRASPLGPLASLLSLGFFRRPGLALYRAIAGHRRLSARLLVWKFRKAPFEPAWSNPAAATAIAAAWAARVLAFRRGL